MTKIAFLVFMILGVLWIGYKMGSGVSEDDIPVAYNPDKLYHERFNKEVGNLLKLGCLPSFRTKTYWSLPRHWSYSYDTYVNRWENKAGGYTYFIKSWSDGEARQVEDKSLGEIIPCKIIKHDRWRELE